MSGESKEAKDITGSWAGTVLHMASEVSYSKRYSFQPSLKNLAMLALDAVFGRFAYNAFRG